MRIVIEMFGRQLAFGTGPVPTPLDLATLMGAAEYERQGNAMVMRRDYWDSNHKNRLRVCVLHDPEADEPRPFIVDHLLEELGIVDGDEFEIMVTATDRRPHGDRRWVYRDGGQHFSGETDEECLRRIESNA